MSVSFLSFSLATPLLFLCLGAGQLGAWAMWRSRPELAWLGLGFWVASVGMVLQLLGQHQQMHEYVSMASVAYIVAAILVGQALARRLCAPMPWALVAALAAAVLLWLGWNLQQPTWHLLWAQGFTLGCMLIAAAPLVHWSHLRLHNRLDDALRGLYAAGVVLSVLRWMLRALALPGDVLQVEPAQSWVLLCTHLMCMALGMMVAGAMFFAVLQDVLQDMNQERQQDPLTRLLNRRGFVEQALQQRKQTALHAQQWALLVCDLDHFKQVNDRWGHMVGDAALCSVAQLLKARLRASDVVARFGGEEFVVLLPGHDAQQAQQVAERIRDGVAQLRIPELQGEHITMSIGAVQLAGVHMNDLEQGLRAADAQMYVAKRSGRNRVMGAGKGDSALVI